ncbi:MAG: hypothetical protein K2K37_02445, partial [Muribaculaceae bacterium]|nr:hypothetical protein [Muribaculaceae bacterium]
MNRIICNLRLFMLITTILGAIGAKAQENAEPIITIRSSAYTEIGEDNKFSLFLGTLKTGTYTVEQCTGTTQVEVKPGSFNSETENFDGTWIPCKVDAEGVIKIYGDPDNINILSAEGAYITSIDMERCVNLEAINLQHNALQRLDLTPFTNAFAIYLSDNPFTAETPLIVGAPKPQLAILEIDIVDHLDQSFNLSDYPNMVAFDGYYNSDLRNVDPTGCPNLMVLSVEMTPVETLDVSKNPELMRLNISESRIRDIDISHNPKLQHFLASHSSGSINTDIKLDHIDLSHNPELMLLNLSYNNFTSLDLSHNTKLTNISLAHNLLTSIDLSANTQLYSVSVMKNLMNFATLPSPMPTWGEYYYEQMPIQLPRSIAVGETIDLSDKVLRPDTETSATVYRKPYGSQPFALSSSLYTYADGKITFNTAITDSVYVEFYNSELYEYPLQTTPILIKKAEEMGLPSVIASFALSAPVEGNISFAVGISGASAESPKTFLVRMDDTDIECTTTFSDDSDIPNVELSFPSEYTGPFEILINEGDVMTSFDIRSIPLSKLNVTAATELRRLTAADCGLYDIDLRYNRCLNSLNLSGNQLFSLDLTGIYGDYDKYVLYDIDVSHNLLSDITIISTTQIRSLNLSYNKLQSFILKDFDRIRSLNLSHNELAGDISLAYLADANDIDLSDNYISGLTLPEFSSLQHMDLSGNNMSIASLPLISELNAAEYIYAPQRPLQIPAKDNSANLTAQYRIIDGETTTFTWFKADGSQIAEGDDMICSDGYATFLNNELGMVHCHITHPAFPQFEGDNVLSTTEMEVANTPTLLATFTTISNSQSGEVIFASKTPGTILIDWIGDGSEIKEYTSVEKYTSYPDQRTYAGATVNVYSFDTPENITVFSIYDIAMGEADLSNLTNAKTIALGGAGLTPDKIKMPDNPGLEELNLIGNHFSDFPYADRYPALRSLVLADNDFTSFDAATIPSLEVLVLDTNHLTDISFDNPSLWGVSLGSNNLDHIDLNGLPVLHQIVLNNNNLAGIDLNPVGETIHLIELSGNRFTFATLPDFYEYPMLSVVRLGYQADVEAECIDGIVDMSARLQGNGKGTVFT